MSIKKYLRPINPDDLGYMPSGVTATIGDRTNAYTTAGDAFPDIPAGSLVLLGVPEDRGAEQNAGTAAAPNEIRRYLYRLTAPVEDVSIIDLGDIILGQTPDDTYYAVAEVVANVIAADSTLILLGGSQDLTFAAYKGYERLNRIVNIAAIDPRFDLEVNDIITSRTWIRNIIMQVPNYLFLLSNIGYQTYFVGQKSVQLMDELKFDAYRLGEIQGDMSRAEALLRNADLVSVDISAVRQSDAPGHGDPSPHGFYGEEFCQMMRYAGASDKTTCLGIFDINPLYDNHGQTAHAVAQALWYFIESFFNRKKDNPRLNPENCKHFIIDLEDQGMVIDFYKSKLTDRWWVQVPCDDPDRQSLYSEHLMLPCTYADYQQAMSGDVPVLWWNYFQRMNG